MLARAVLAGAFNATWPRQICAEVGGGSYPGLLARMQRGRVSALVALIAVCD